MSPSLLPDLVKDSQLLVAFRGDTTVHRFTSTDLSGRRVKYEEEWKIDKHLGHGSYGRVWKESCVSNHSDVPKARAVKMILKPQCPSKRLDYNRELEAIAKFSHPKYESCFVKSFGWYESREAIFIAMEFMSYGDLQKYMPETGESFSTQDTQDTISQILEGLFYMHENGFAHRDLKPANILVKSKPPDNEKWWVKIGDFGISKRAEDGNGPSTVKGTFGFMAPEVLLAASSTGRAKGSFDAQPTDLWALGEIAFRMLCGAPTFKDILSMLRWMENPTSSFLDQLQPLVASEVVNFIQGLLKADPTKRLSAKRAMKHVWMSPSSTLLEPESLPLPSTAEQGWPQYPQQKETFKFCEASAKWSTLNPPTTIQADTSQEKTLHPGPLSQSELSAPPAEDSNSTTKPRTPEFPIGPTTPKLSQDWLPALQCSPRSSPIIKSKDGRLNDLRDLMANWNLPRYLPRKKKTTATTLEVYQDSKERGLPNLTGKGGEAAEIISICPKCKTRQMVSVAPQAAEVECSGCNFRYWISPQGFVTSKVLPKSTINLSRTVKDEHYDSPHSSDFKQDPSPLPVPPIVRRSKKPSVPNARRDQEEADSDASSSDSTRAMLSSVRKLEQSDADEHGSLYDELHSGEPNRPSTLLEGPTQGKIRVARKWGIPDGPSIGLWDPEERPFTVLEGTLDSGSMGKWIYDWTLYHHGPNTPLAAMAGKLWISLTKLAYMMEVGEDWMFRLRTAKDHDRTQAIPSQANQDVIGKFLASGQKLWIRLAKLLDACEEYMWLAPKEVNHGTLWSDIGKKPGCDFVDALFSRDHKLEKTEELMMDMHIWSMRFDSRCGDILRQMESAETRRRAQKILDYEDDVIAYMEERKTNNVKASKRI
ncbi:kinase-like protein [Lindgomyces ingoldianus]|uniref:Kinase-like protein n=1 Tax=Lindgomyces ingoldianus TaxID=673940 RepID=A0ACB6RC94_9PLEO|nr:kinase-like protein [Lindgomyces ingoldianus]KAF2476874.1 kinase-like protein [Lindgomyces ingoldianus]